jgi:hypothetical protein
MIVGVTVQFSSRSIFSAARPPYVVFVLMFLRRKALLLTVIPSWMEPLRSPVTGSVVGVPH